MWESNNQQDGMPTSRGRRALERVWKLRLPDAGTGLLRSREGGGRGRRGKCALCWDSSSSLLELNLKIVIQLGSLILGPRLPDFL